MDKQRTILCYGDSNTWGAVPGTINWKTMYLERYKRDVRWTGKLQDLLGSDYYVIEEGLSGRTTNVDYTAKKGCNGKTYLGPCLFSHAPLDLVIIYLGINDLKVEFNRSAKEIVDGLAELVDLVQSSTFGADMQLAPKVLLVNNISLSSESFQDMNNDFVFKGALEKCQQIGPYYSELVDDKQCYYLDVTPVISQSKIDGCHLDAQAHAQLAQLLEKEVRKIFA